MRRPAYCGMDVGTQGVRACLLAEDGRQLGAGRASLSGGRRAQDRHEQDPRAWWAATVAAVREALAAAGDVYVRAIAVDATSGTVLVEGADGTARGPALMYDDARAVTEAARVQRVGQSLWDELGYRMQPTWALPKVLWLHSEDAVSAGDRVVHQSDHLVRRLTGATVATDTSSALKTGADLRTVSWPVEVLAELDIPVGNLPDLVLPGSELGVIGAEAAAETGLPAGAVVRAGMTDGCAAQIAAAALRPGRWSSALGTTLVLKGSTAELVRDPSGAVYSHRHPDGGWLPGGASSIGAGVFRSILPGADLAALTAQAYARPPYAGTAYPLDGRGERFPFTATEATAFWDPAPSDDVERFVAACQGIAYVERLAYDVLRTLGAGTSGPVALTGGSTRNQWWNQLRTDVLGRATVVPRSAEAATGMAILAMAETGDLTGTAERLVGTDQTFEPDPARGADLEPGYRRLVAELAERGWLPVATAGAVLAAAVAP